MTKKYIKNPIPGEISEQGGATAIFVDKETVPLETSIREALQGNYATGQETLIKNLFMGVMQSMIAGVVRDGHPRTLAGLITVYLVVKGEFDLEKGWDDEVNSIRVRARLLNELDIDITGWVFEDVTPGKRSFSITTVKAGDVKGEYVIGKPGEINGDRFPNTQLGETIRVDWAVEGTDRAGTLDAELVASDATRIDIDESAFAELKTPECDGKTLTFTVRGNFSNRKKSAVIRYAAPEVRIDSAYAEFDGDDEVVTGRLTGANLKMLDGDTLGYAIDAGGTHTGEATVTESGDGSVFFTIDGASADWVGKELTLTLKSRGGEESAPEQTNVVKTEVEEA